MSEFFESPMGTAATLGGLVLLLIIFGLRQYKKQGLSVKMLTYSAFCIALATILSFVKILPMPQGGSVTVCSMLFLSLVGYWFGTAYGIMAGVTYGLLQLAMGGYVVHPIQLLLDYPLAFGALGLSGLVGQSKWRLQLGFTIGVAGRLLCSVLSGVVFFGSYAPPEQNVVVYSLLYNLSYMGPEYIITMALICIPAFRRVVNSVK